MLFKCVFGKVNGKLSGLRVRLSRRWPESEKKFKNLLITLIFSLLAIITQPIIIDVL